MFSKGDLVLISCPDHAHAGCTGKIKKVKARGNMIIVKLFEKKLDIWIESTRLIKITQDQQESFKMNLKEKKDA